MAAAVTVLGVAAGSAAAAWPTPGEGFAAEMSWNQGQLAEFKLAGGAAALRIYRMGVNGLDGQLVDTAAVEAAIASGQPACPDLPMGSADCSNWRVDATWAIPAKAPSAIYQAVPVAASGRTGFPIPFVVRCDSCHAAIVVVTSDATWQAYNTWGGGSLYRGTNRASGTKGREYEVSYNRPLTLSYSVPWSAEYPMLSYLTANGFSFSYVSQLDVQVDPSILLGHRVVMMVGHSEYWSPVMRAAVQQAVDDGESFFDAAGNEMYWQTRPDRDLAGQPDRTIICYKETLANRDINPSLQWTGTMRDTRFSPPNDAAGPENALTGQLFTVDVAVRNDRYQFTEQQGRSPFLRATAAAALAPGQVYTAPAGTEGYEVDQPVDDGSAVLPANELALSTERVAGVDLLEPTGSPPTYARIAWHRDQTVTYHATLYQAPSGALVFAAGSVQWSWGLSNDHWYHGGSTRDGPTADPVMQQATANMLIDMGAPPADPQPRIVVTAPEPFSAYQAALPRARAPVDPAQYPASAVQHPAPTVPSDEDDGS